ncbi:hypothetical protein Pcinc_035403 [Petrolisthes cinctipes]|uniref:Condensation domain-containing protein n=1 Tax=Petrolisthes cinctipes TaxID=88211 RepID=A0AAE1ENC9_PETCI|nr:hypothetical protein Pcinc_035403 [Petrolisthes cinctipes]
MIQQFQVTTHFITRMRTMRNMTAHLGLPSQQWPFKSLLLSSQPCSSLHTTRKVEEDEGEWLWPADWGSQLYHHCNLRGTRKGTFGITINTAMPILPSHLNQAFTHLCRQLPVLQIVMKLQEDTPWFFRRSTPMPNFQFVEDEGSLDDICNKVSEQNFTYNDLAFWRAWVVPRGPDVPCPMPELRTSLPHQYDVAMSIHHGLGDGLDAGLVTKCLIDILSKILSGQSVDDTPLGIINNKDDVKILKEKVRQKLLVDPERIDVVRRTLPPPQHKPLLLQIAPKPGISKSSTETVSRTLHKEVVTNFKQWVKDTGITYNSGLVAAVNTALVELAIAEGFKQDTFNIMLGMNITIRRYLPKSSVYRFGPYNTNLSLPSSVRRDVKENFWEYARQLHHDLMTGIKSGLALEQEVVRNLGQPLLSPEETAALPQPHVHDFAISNLGDISAGLTAESNHLQVTNVLSTNVIHNWFWSNLQIICTYRGQTYYSLCYDTQYLTHDTASRFLDQIVSVVKEVSGTKASPTLRSKM